MSMLTVLKSTARAAVVAATLAVPAMMVAAPAQAAPPNFNFSMQFGNGFGGPGMKFDYGNGPQKMCLSDKQIYWQLDDYGFNRIKIVKSSGYKVIVIARYHGDWYQLAVDRCTGKIRRAPLHFNGNGNGNGPMSQFGITLNF
jgi:hypothetical protein